MKRWLIILVILILPAQATVAAICSYCAHRSSDSTNSIAVHALAHAAGSLAAAAEQQSDAGPQTGVDDADCAVCQVGHSTITVAPIIACAPLHRDSPPAWEARFRGPLVVDGIEHVPLPLAVG